MAQIVAFYPLCNKSKLTSYSKMMLTYIVSFLDILNNFYNFLLKIFKDDMWVANGVGLNILCGDWLLCNSYCGFQFLIQSIKVRTPLDTVSADVSHLEV